MTRFHRYSMAILSNLVFVDFNSFIGNSAKLVLTNCVLSNFTSQFPIDFQNSELEMYGVVLENSPGISLQESKLTCIGCVGSNVLFSRVFDIISYESNLTDLFSHYFILKAQHQPSKIALSRSKKFRKPDHKIFNEFLVIMETMKQELLPYGTNNKLQRGN